MNSKIHFFRKQLNAFSYWVHMHGFLDIVFGHAQVSNMSIYHYYIQDFSYKCTSISVHVIFPDFRIFFLCL